MKNKVYKLLLPMLLVTSFGAMKAGEVSMKPIAPHSTSADIIILYKLADTLDQSGLKSLATLTRDTASILGNSYIYRAVKMTALLSLLYQVGQKLKNNPANDALMGAYVALYQLGLMTYFLAGDFGKPYTEKFKPWYDFAPAPNA
jgi:hypothetical protein